MNPASVRRWLALLLALQVAAGLRAAPQRAGIAPEVEVVSIKLNRNCPAAGLVPVLSPGRAQVPCITAQSLIRLAYGTFTGSELSPRVPDVVGGPEWINNDFYQVAGTTTAPVPPAQMLGAMARPVLENRFKLKVHLEPREASVYFLTAAGPNTNLPLTKEGDCVPMDIFAELMGKRSVTGPATCGTGRGTPRGSVMAFDWTGVTMEEFAGRLLSTYVDRPVIDRTGLAGRYNLHMEFAPHVGQRIAVLNGQAVTLPEADNLGDSVFNVLQKQLGLKLTPGKAPLDVIVVDSIERPSEN
jgi:uncharacterized protein (TIGR03435 family)